MAQRSRLIRVDPSTAFAYLSDLTRHHEWAINSLRVQPVDTGPVRQGQRYHSTGRQFGQRLEDEVLVTAYEPDRRFEFESRGRGGVFRHAFLLEPRPGGTLVTKVMEPRTMPFPFSLFAPVTNVVLAGRMAKDLKRIAQRLEGGLHPDLTNRSQGKR